MTLPIRGCAFALLVVVIFACGAPAPQTSPIAPDISLGPNASDRATELPPALGPSPTSQVSVSQDAALLTAAGQAIHLGAEAFDADGSPLPISWRSSNPQQVSVSADGNVTALVDVGSALVFAQAGNSEVPVTVVIAQPAPGAVLVADEQIVIQPVPSVPIDDMPENGDRFRVVLSGIDPPAAGTILLATGDVPLAGRVVSSGAAINGLLVEYELVPLPELLTRYDFAFDYPIDLAAAGLTPSASTPRLQAALEGSLAPVPDLARGIEAKPEAKAEFEKGPLKCTASASAKFKSDVFEIKVTSKLSLLYEGSKEVADASAPEHTKVLVSGPIALDISGGLKAEAGFEGSVGCQLKVDIPIGPPGPLGAVVAATVPLGLSASAEGKIKAVDVELGPKGHLGTTVSVGFECNSVACWSIAQQIPDPNNGIDWVTKVQLPPDAHVDVSLALNVISGLGARIFGDTYGLIDAKIGPVQSLNLAFDTAQARDQAYASNYDVKVAASVSPSDDLKKAIERLVGDGFTLDLTADYASDPLVSSPTGVLTTEKTKVQVDRPVMLYVDLDPATINYPVIGENVDEIRFGRFKDNALTSIGSIPVRTSGQTHFEFEWTPDDEFLGMNELVAFTVTNGVPKVPLEIAAKSSAFVEVVDACLPDTPASIPPAPIGSSPPQVGPIPSATPAPDPCHFDVTITFSMEHPGPKVNDDHWTFTGNLDPRDEVELEPGQPEGTFVGVGQFEGSGVREFYCPPDEVDPYPVVPGSGRVWLTAEPVDDVGLWDPALAGRSGYLVSWLVPSEDMLANPDSVFPPLGDGWIAIPGETHSFTETFGPEEFPACGDGTIRTLTTTLGALDDPS